MLESWSLPPHHITQARVAWSPASAGYVLCDVRLPQYTCRGSRDAIAQSVYPADEHCHGSDKLTVHAPHDKLVSCQPSHEQGWRVPRGIYIAAGWGPDVSKAYTTRHPGEYVLYTYTTYFWGVIYNTYPIRRMLHCGRTDRALEVGYPTLAQVQYEFKSCVRGCIRLRVDLYYNHPLTVLVGAPIP